MIKLTSPSSETLTEAQVQTALSAFEDRFKKEDQGLDYYHLVIIGELPRSVSNAVEQAYRNVGWNIVRCRTSSENGERGGLTGLVLQR